MNKIRIVDKITNELVNDIIDEIDGYDKYHKISGLPDYYDGAYVSECSIEDYDKLGLVKEIINIIEKHVNYRELTDDEIEQYLSTKSLQRDILLELIIWDKFTTIAELQETFRKAKSSLSSAVSSLESVGLIYKFADPYDARIVRIDIRPKHKEFLKRVLTF